MLIGRMYEPETHCNRVGPWIQGVLSILNQLAAEKPDILARGFMDRLSY